MTNNQTNVMTFCRLQIQPKITCRTTRRKLSLSARLWRLWETYYTVQIQRIKLTIYHSRPRVVESNNSFYSPLPKTIWTICHSSFCHNRTWTSFLTFRISVYNFLESMWKRIGLIVRNCYYYVRCLFFKCLIN